MLLKLYKTEDDGKILYWEAWDDDEEIVVHFGELGTVGESTNLPLAEFEPPETAIKRAAEEAREAGFAEVEHEELFEFVVQYPLTGGDPQQAVDKGFRVEEILNECLGWTGLGHCDGNDVVEGAINIYCYVVEPTVAVNPVVEELRTNDVLDGAVIAYQDKNENFVVLWPRDFDGIFIY